METRKNITGKTLIALGFESGKWFPEAIEHLNKKTEEAKKRQQQRG